MGKCSKVRNSLISVFIVTLIIAVVGNFSYLEYKLRIKWSLPRKNTNQNWKENQIISLVTDFGNKIKDVSLLAPPEIVIKSIEENYGRYVSPDLLAEWRKDPESAPGRVVSSPWPERTEILRIEKISRSAYAVKGNIIEITSIRLLMVELQQRGKSIL